MKYSLELLSNSSSEWIDAVMSDFDAFLIDHADCERKASAMAMSLVAKYPNRLKIIPELIETGIEELEHFQQVYELMQKRGLQLPHGIQKDPYVNAILKHLHSDIELRFIDRLLIGSVVECRGAERFKLVSEALEEPELKQFYKALWTSEAKHGNIFVKFALHYKDEEYVYKRLNQWLEIEAGILENLEIKAALH